MKQQLFITIGIILSTFFAGCTTDIGEESNEEHVCRLVFNVSKQGFGNTRAAEEEWKNGDCVYLSFLFDEELIDGKAIYDARTEYWTLYYNGQQIPSGAASICTAYFFEDDFNDSGEYVKLSPMTCIYADLEGSYKKTLDEISVTVNLTPMSGRIRFKGEAGKEFQVIGTTSYSSLDKTQAFLNQTDNAVTATIAQDGCSPYLYLGLNSTMRTLTIFYDNLSFSTDCEHPILDAGQSGYMTLPTKQEHNGWRMTEKTLATVGSVSVADITMNSVSLVSMITSNGNGTVRECGFCYSTSPEPMVSDMKVSCGIAESSFKCTLTSLSPKTKYYVRAYVVNEVGTAYSEEISFQTAGSKPTNDDNVTPQV